MIFSCV